MFDQLGEPGVIDVAAEVASLDAGVPETGYDEERGGDNCEISRGNNEPRPMDGNERKKNLSRTPRTS